MSKSLESSFEPVAKAGAVSWPIVSVASWADFLALVDRLDRGPAVAPNYVARGQSDGAWGLVPTLLRDLSGDVSHEALIELEATLQREFVSQAFLHIDAEALGGRHNQLQKWAVMQHHGAPTRLLDWSRSLFVAAYYAVDSKWDCDGAIWLCHQRALEIEVERQHPGYARNWTLSLFDSDAPQALCIWVPDRRTGRMTAQQGVFTVAANPLTSHEEVIYSLSAPRYAEALVFGKAVVPARLKPQFLRNLKAMNITANALFPGIDGLGRSMSELRRLSILPGHGRAEEAV